MVVAHRPRPRSRASTRIVPTVLDLTAAGAEITASNGAIVSQYDSPPPAVGTTHTFVRMQLAAFPAVSPTSVAVTPTLPRRWERAGVQLQRSPGAVQRE